MRKNSFVSFCMLLFPCIYAGAQDSLGMQNLTFSGYAEVYYSYDLNQPGDHNKAFFLYNFSRHNEMNLNLGYINADYTASKIRANFGLMAGTYPQNNLSAEQPLLQHVWQANAGIRLAHQKELWLDAGIFPSHIGFESPVGKNCDALTRSIMAENTPSYESGLKLSYVSGNGKWFLAGMVINGWQRIARVDGNNTPAFGAEILWTPNTSVSLNYSTFAGNDKPDTAKQMRYYQDLYGIFSLGKCKITTGFDFCVEQKAPEASDYNILYAPEILFRYQFSDAFAVCARYEYYSDAGGIILATGTPNGFRTAGYSANFDYLASPNAILRLEIRSFSSQDAIFVMGEKSIKTDIFVTTSFAVSF